MIYCLAMMANKSPRFLKSLGDNVIENAAMELLMERRSKLLWQMGSDNPDNPYRTGNFAQRLQVTTACVARWSSCSNHPRSFGTWERICHALHLTFEVRIFNELGHVIFQSSNKDGFGKVG